MSGSPPADGDVGPNDPANLAEPPAPPPPLSFAQVAESLSLFQSQLEQIQAAQSNPAGAGPSRSYAQAAAEPEWRDNARKLEGIARVAGHL